jgi:outer membrane protein OmpA-like peptidoglycan-associated protein
MIFARGTLLVVTGLFGLSACTLTGFDPNNRTQSGALAGAVIGGAIGATQDEDRLAKTVLGAAIGAGVGAAIGNALQRQEEQLRGQLGPNVQVVNEGNQLRVVMPQDILFATDSAVLQPTLVRDLQAVAQSLLDYPRSTIQVIGHTDNVGSAAYNAQLSQRRANSVAAVLIDYGVPAGRIVAFGRGMDAPVASNQTAEGRQKNRRVEIIIRPTA